MDASLLSTAVNAAAALLIHSVWQGLLIGLAYALSMLALAHASPSSLHPVNEPS